MMLVCGVLVMSVAAAAWEGPDSTQESLPVIDSLWDYRDNAGSERRFRELLGRVEGSAGAEYVAELLTQLARAQGRQGRFAEAHATLDQAAGLIAPEMARARVRLLLERGRVFNSGGEPARGLLLFREAYEVGLGAGLNRLAVDAVHMVAIAESDPAKQVEWNLKGVELAERLGERGWLYALYNNLGEAYAARKEFGKALATFEKLVALDTAAGKEPDLMAQKDVARMLNLLGRHAEALAMLEPIVRKLEGEGKPSGWLDEQYAEALLGLGRGAESGPYFGRAYEAQAKEEWVRKSEEKRLERLRRLRGR